MIKKVYEMPDDHKRVVGNLIKRIEERDRIKQTIKDGNVKNHKLAVKLLADFEKSIDELEQSLVNEYDLHQKYQATLEEADALHEKFIAMIEGMIADMDENAPELAEIARAIMEESNIREV
jgi:phytoene/squalene synthetase